MSKRLPMPLIILGLLVSCRPTPAPPPAATATPRPTVAPAPVTPTTASPLPTPLPTDTSQPTATPLPTADPALPPALLLRGPLLQSVTPAGITVVWDTDRPGIGCVVYGLARPGEARRCESAPTAHHSLTLTGLPSYTRVDYQLQTDDRSLSLPAQFRTAAAPDQTTFNLAVLGDTRSNPEVHRRVVAALLAQPPDFYLHTGDLVGDGWEPGLWDEFFAAEAELLRISPIYPTLGNHEKESDLYFDAFQLPGNERWYAFDYGNLHVTVLHLDSDGALNSAAEQLAWLENDLAGTDRTWKLLLTHAPLYSSGPHGGNAEARALLEPLLLEYGVDLVFSGHDHLYERNVVQGITHIVTGGGGAPLYEPLFSNPASVYRSTRYHFVRIAVDGPTLQISAVTPEGELLDTVTLQKPR